MIRLASIFGGTSIYGGIPWREVDSLIWFSGSQICSGAYKGHDARMIVPLPSVDSIAKEPPDSSTRSLMLESPNPRLVGVNDVESAHPKASALDLCQK
jgi:hypothetical protein